MTEDEVVDALRLRARVEGWPSPASVDAVAEAERAIGYPLPRLLRRLYLEAANGGFGPRQGIPGVRGGHRDSEWGDLVELNEFFGVEHREDVPPGLIWMLDWGCTIWTLIDCRDPSAMMWGHEEGDFYSQRSTLVDWLARYLDGEGERLMPDRPRPPAPRQILRRSDLRG